MVFFFGFCKKQFNFCTFLTINGYVLWIMIKLSMWKCKQSNNLTNFWENFSIKRDLTLLKIRFHRDLRFQIPLLIVLRRITVRSVKIQCNTFHYYHSRKFIELKRMEWNHLLLMHMYFIFLRNCSLIHLTKYNDLFCFIILFIIDHLRWWIETEFLWSRIIWNYEKKTYVIISAILIYQLIRASSSYLNEIHQIASLKICLMIIIHISHDIFKMDNLEFIITSIHVDNKRHTKKLESFFLFLVQQKRKLKGNKKVCFINKN